MEREVCRGGWEFCQPSPNHARVNQVSALSLDFEASTTFSPRFNHLSHLYLFHSTSDHERYNSTSATTTTANPPTISWIESLISFSTHSCATRNAEPAGIANSRNLR